MCGRFPCGALVCLLIACATGAPEGARSTHWAFQGFSPPAVARPLPKEQERRGAVLDEAARARVVAAAQRFVGTKTGADCTGLVRAVFEPLQVDLLADAEPADNGVTAIYRYAQARGRVFTGGHALPGDLVFFKDTYDQNHDGRSNDGLTHVGIVESVDAEGTVSVIHRVQRGVVRYRMSLAHPDVRNDPRTGQPINDYLRPASGGRPPVLAGQLFAAYATLFVAEPVARR